MLEHPRGMSLYRLNSYPALRLTFPLGHTTSDAAAKPTFWETQDYQMLMFDIVSLVRLPDKRRINRVSDR